MLLLLQPDGAMTRRAIAGQLQYDASNLTGVVDRLEEMGAVRHQPHHVTAAPKETCSRPRASARGGPSGIASPATPGRWAG